MTLFNAIGMPSPIGTFVSAKLPSHPCNYFNCHELPSLSPSAYYIPYYLKVNPVILQVNICINCRSPCTGLVLYLIIGERARHCIKSK